MYCTWYAEAHIACASFTSFQKSGICESAATSERTYHTLVRAADNPHPALHRMHLAAGVKHHPCMAEGRRRRLQHHTARREALGQAINAVLQQLARLVRGGAGSEESKVGLNGFVTQRVVIPSNVVGKKHFRHIHTYAHAFTELPPHIGVKDVLQLELGTHTCHANETYA